MTPSKKRLGAFTAEYFHSQQSRLGISRATRQKAEAIKTLIIDTDSLATGNLHFSRTISTSLGTPHSDERLRLAAGQALAGHNTTEARALMRALDVPAAKIEPIAAPNDIVLGSVWHHGEGFHASWIGSLASITHYADLTENEREKLHILSRKLAAEGAVVYAIATSKSAAQPHRYRDVRATYLGLLVFNPVLFTGTEKTVADIRSNGLNIIYASGNPEHVVQSFAHVSCIAPNHVIAYKYRRGHPLSVDKMLYASLPPAARQQIIAHYGSEALVVRGSLVDFWQQFSVLRK